MTKAAVVSTLLAAAMFGVAGPASADGIVTWTNKGTGYDLAYDSNNAYVGSGPGQANILQGQWYDRQQSDGTWLEANQYENANWCLDSNNQWANGQQGNVYLTPCGTTTTNNYQKWYEIPTSNGWALRDKQTGLYLDGGAGPLNHYAYTNGAYGLGNNYQHWT